MGHTNLYCSNLVLEPKVMPAVCAWICTKPSSGWEDTLGPHPTPVSRPPVSGPSGCSGSQEHSHLFSLFSFPQWGVTPVGYEDGQKGRPLPIILQACSGSGTTQLLAPSLMAYDGLTQGDFSRHKERSGPSDLLLESKNQPRRHQLVCSACPPRSGPQASHCLSEEGSLSKKLVTGPGRQAGQGPLSGTPCPALESALFPVGTA